MTNVTFKGLLKVLGRLGDSRVLVVGDVILDQYVWGKVRRISPEAPVPVVEVDEMTFRLGGAANVAAGVVALGGSAELAGVVGDDMYGEKIAALLAEHGISGEGLLRDNSRPTTLKTRIIAHSQQVVRYDHEVREKPSREQSAKIAAWIKNRIEEMNAVTLSDYDKGVLRASLGPMIVKLARQRGVVVTADPKVPNVSRFRGADVITPNQLETEQITGIPINSDASLEKAGCALIKKLKPGAILITRGEAGMSLFMEDRETAHVPALARQVFDVTGAGDTAIAALTMAMAAGASPLEASYLANAAASVTVGKLGTATVSAEELESSLREEMSK